jgi:hypothetical protein
MPTPNYATRHPGHKIHNWRSRLRHAYILSISSRAVFTLQDICQAVAQARQLSLPTCVITFTFDDVVNTLSHAGLPQIYFDQLHVMQGHIDQAKFAAVNHININAPRLRRNNLLSSPTWPAWQDAEFLQLDNYHAQGMFGDPIIPPSASAIFHWVWIYSIKTQENNRKKARAVCDVSTRGGAAHGTGHTYAATPDMIDFLLQLAISALRGYTVYHSDVSNAFAEAGRPEQHNFMQVDTAFRNWWNSRFPASPLMPGQAIPILRNLQGHPEAPRQWSKHIDGILCNNLHFTPTTHAPCLYTGNIDRQTVLLLRQVDDFSTACLHSSTYHTICGRLDTKLKVPITRHGLLKHFNGIDVIQTRDHILISVETYLDSVLTSHGWLDLLPLSLPMRADNDYIKSLDTAIPLDSDTRDQMDKDRFRYRGAIGELIWPMITTRPELAFPVVKLSQFSVSPAVIHYDAILSIFRYLTHTRSRGITYTHQPPVQPLPPLNPLPCLASLADHVNDHLSHLALYYILHGYSDSDWAMDIRHRQSITGLLMLLAGGSIASKCRVQTTISLSTTEAEFLSATDAGRLAYYIFAPFWLISTSNKMKPPIFDDNRGSVLMSQAS